MLCSQPQISLLGVLPLTTVRWANLAADTSVDVIETALAELEVARFILVDRDTEEVLVRTFIHHDGVWKSPQTRGAALNQRSMVVSTLILGVLETEIERAEARRESKALGNTPSDTESGTPGQTVPTTPSDTESDRSRTRARAISSLQSPSPVSNLHSPSQTPAVALAAFELVARKRLKDRSGPPITNTKAWLTKVTGEVGQEHDELARKIIERQPDISAETLAWDLEHPEVAAQESARVDRIADARNWGINAAAKCPDRGSLDEAMTPKSLTLEETEAVIEGWEEASRASWSAKSRAASG